MAAEFGNLACVKADGSTLVEATGWTLNRSVQVHEYRSCQTGGDVARVTGGQDAQGMLEGVTDPSDHISDYIEPGDSVLLSLYLNATKGHSVYAKILTLDETGKVGEMLSWSATFAMDKTAGAPTYDTTLS